ncbi:MAG: YkgJ family cysteine cluster protein, partial [Bacteroidetes bacterium]|nr:YkgJ family cysteine cluster protein [Bacteroidota bacterium]
MRVTDEEIVAIARYLRMSERQVRADYTMQDPFFGREVTVSRDHPDTTRCIFLDSHNRCRIHAVKPQ